MYPSTFTKYTYCVRCKLNLKLLFSRNIHIADISENISKKVDCVLVVGSESSSNTNALVESIRNINKKAYRVEKSNDLIKILYELLLMSFYLI